MGRSGCAWALRAALVVVVAVTVLVGSPPATVNADPSTYGWPVTTPQVLHRYDPPAQRWLPGHRGVDLAAAAGDTIFAAGLGVVSYVGRIDGVAIVSVQHPDGITTTYQPVTASVTVGTAVERGSPLGQLTTAGAHCAPTCLHWGAKRGVGRAAAYLNPLALLGVVRVRLKPLAPSDGKNVPGVS